VPGARDAHARTVHDHRRGAGGRLVAISPAAWSIDWSRWLPMWAWAYLSPVLGPSFPLFPAVPWSAFILVGAALGQIYSSWGGSHLVGFANRVLLIPGLVAVAAGYGAAFLPVDAFRQRRAQRAAGGPAHSNRRLHGDHGRHRPRQPARRASAARLQRRSRRKRSSSTSFTCA
jgi:hypothetical protein